MKPGRAVVDILLAEGVRFVFGLPGGHVLGIYDALYETPEIRHILVRHEQAAAIMAAAYAQLTGDPGVCLVTAGPGCTNLLTGIAEAYVGSLPIVAIAGRGATFNAHRGAAQEVDTDRIFAPVTKWSVKVDRTEQIPEAIGEAFKIARSGRPGPVLVDIPRDLFDTDIAGAPYVAAGPPERPSADPAAIAAAVALLVEAERPLLIAGGGTVASGAFAELRELAEHLAIPVLTSLAGRGSISDDHPLSAGGLGTHRNRAAKRLLGEADVVIGLGTRFEEMETNWRPGTVPAPEAAYVQVDIEPGEIGRSVPATSGSSPTSGQRSSSSSRSSDRRGVESLAPTLTEHERVRDHRRAARNDRARLRRRRRHGRGPDPSRPGDPRDSPRVSRGRRRSRSTSAASPSTSPAALPSSRCSSHGR